jgi:hypothetical protein
MTPRPIYRWKSLWLGFFVLGFLSWAWWESYRQPFHITRLQAPRYYQAFHAQGEIVFRHGNGATNTVWWTDKLSPMSPPISEVKANWDRDGSNYLAVPYTGIMAASTLGLAGFVVWRTRRWKRRAAGTATIGI